MRDHELIPKKSQSMRTKCPCNHQWCSFKTKSEFFHPFSCHPTNRRGRRKADHIIILYDERTYCEVISWLTESWLYWLIIYKTFFCSFYNSNRSFGPFLTILPVLKGHLCSLNVSLDLKVFLENEIFIDCEGFSGQRRSRESCASVSVLQSLFAFCQ